MASVEKDSHLLCPACNHEYGYHDKDGTCHKGCCGCGSACDMNQH